MTQLESEREAAAAKAEQKKEEAKAVEAEARKEKHEAKADAAEAKHQRWLAEHTKPCPGCGANIERNRGCNHMKCKGCGHEFCWACLAEWSTHGEATGGYFQCNVFDPREYAVTLRRLRQADLASTLPLDNRRDLEAPLP